MPRRPTTLLTDRESEIMTILWELGSATPETIRQRMEGEPHDSTVRTLLRVLVTKRHVVADKRVRPAVYRPAAEQQNVQRSVARDLVSRFFGGSAEDLVVHLLEDERLTPEQLRRLEEAFRSREGGDSSDASSHKTTHGESEQ